MTKQQSASALPTKPVGEWSFDEQLAVLARAAGGDAGALVLARQVLDAAPALVDRLCNLETRAEDGLLNLLTGSKDVLSREIYSRKLAAMRLELAGPAPTPLERLLVGRIVACWLQVQNADMRVANADGQSITLKMGAYLREGQDSAHRRYLQAITALARVRRLQLPLLQINVAQQQIVANGAGRGDTSADGALAGAKRTS